MQTNETAETPNYTIEELNAQHAAMVQTCAKSGERMLDQLSPDVTHLWHMATGIAGEAGELLDAIKKVACYNKPIDLENIIEELGDLEFYMEGLRSKVGITRERTLLANIAKLGKRYENHQYSDEQAQKRADKVDETVIKNDPPQGGEFQSQVI